jgi:predicted Fe-Mo cluster-binding NifX family protein
MRICIPADTGEGLDAPVCGHFGSAPWFHVVDLDTGATAVVANATHHHEHGACRPLEGLAGHDITAVVCRGIGRNAFHRLAAAGIDVYVSAGSLVRDVVAEARANRLQLVDPGQLCAGGHQHGHRHGAA